MDDLYIYEVEDIGTGEVISSHDDMFNAELVLDPQQQRVVCRKLNAFERMSPEEASRIIQELNEKGVSRPSIAFVLEVAPLTITNWINKGKAGRLSPRQMVKLNRMACLFLK